MGLYDRDYTQENYRSQYRYGPQMRMGLPQITPIVKRLLIINVVVFLAALISRPLGDFLFDWGSVYPATLWMALQIWRLITYQFLHGGIWHIAFNMLGLFFLGPTLERHWGSKRFLTFYLGCGVAGALFYLFLVAVRFLPPLPMVGASGAILGMLAACAILFPQFVVFIMFFPVPIRVAAVLFTFIYIAAVLTRAQNAGGHAAHLAGMAAGAFYVFSERWRSNLKQKIQSAASEKKAAARRDLHAELDRILQKVHDSGIHSLTSKEKRILKQATEAERTRNKL